MGSRIAIFDRQGSISIRQDKDNKSAYISITPVHGNSSMMRVDRNLSRSLGSLLSNGIKSFTQNQNWASDDPHEWFTRSSLTGQSLYAHMPVTGVQIHQGVDMTIAKTLNNDFLVAEFGDVPVRITLTGVNFYGAGKCSNVVSIQKQQVLDFYESNKLSAGTSNRVDISITPAAAPESGSFRCVLIGMETMNPLSEKEAMIPAYSYKLSLIGVRR